ncbi:MAG: hypothetical protein ABIT38_18775 [Gemmatimonadaceae bacterium]
MLNFTRYLATRLRRFASPAPSLYARPLRVAFGERAEGAWDRLDAFITEQETVNTNQRARELVLENARCAITLIGHDGARLVERVAELHEQGAARHSEPALLALTLAHSHGDVRTRDDALQALARVARVRARLTPPGVQRAAGRREVSLEQRI